MSSSTDKQRQALAKVVMQLASDPPPLRFLSAENLGRQLPQLLLALVQLILGPRSTQALRKQARDQDRLQRTNRRCTAYHPPAVALPGRQLSIADLAPGGQTGLGDAPPLELPPVKDIGAFAGWLNSNRRGLFTRQNPQSQLGSFFPGCLEAENAAADDSRAPDRNRHDCKSER